MYTSIYSYAFIDINGILPQKQLYKAFFFFTQQDNDDDEDVKNIKEKEKEENEKDEQEAEEDGKSQPMNVYHAPGIIFG